ncbi:MAG TPA: D-2-hydroxyacid dehydrogenase [Polyangiaceae bacterium]|nr:D-2-hydroxyacid dehydrogenase [Polyangiaceae bacterium]
MKLVLSLPHSIRAFEPQAEQLARWRARYPQHQLVVARAEAEFLRQLADADGALVWRFAAAWYELAPRLRFVATPAAGREKVQPDPSGRVRAVHGSFHGKIMAESLLGMLLFFARRFDFASADQRVRRYERDQYSPTRRLAGQRALIVGYGALGRECARLLKAVGLHVVGVKRQAAVDPAPADAVFALQDLPRLLPEADHVIATLPADTGTDHLFDDAAFAAMRPSAGFYNLGRGNAVDETALLRALNTGSIAHAFLDVFEREPLPNDSPLWSAPNLALTPHASAVNAEYLDLWVDELAGELSGA